jgi:hypothetical protein
VTGSKLLSATIARLALIFPIATFLIASELPARCALSRHSAPLQKSASFGAYTANLYFDPNSNTKDAYFEILKDKKSIYRQNATENGERYNIGTFYDDDPDAKLVAMGRDITGDGQPDLVISKWSGGANCCLTFHIFEIGPKFRKIGDIDAEFGDQGPHFIQLDHGSGLQIQIYDWTFVNWHTDFAQSPAPRVILLYKHGRYRVAPDLMCTQTADMKEVAARVRQVTDQAKDLHGGSWPDADIPPVLWATMLDLIYTCHRLTPWLFVDTAWPQKVHGKEDFVNDFTAQLKQSPYWKSISQLGSLPPRSVSPY